MCRQGLVLAVLIPLGAWAAPARAQENNQPPSGFRALFNGSDLSGWHGMEHFDPRQLAKLSPEARAKKLEAETATARQHWSVQQGELINDGRGPFLTTDEEFGDVELWIDFKIASHADSGIYLRTTPQIQIWDYTDGAFAKFAAEKGSGGLWNNAAGSAGKDPLVLADRPIGEWNRFRIRVIGSRTSIWLNGQLVVDHALWHNFWDASLPLFSRGKLQLQTHGGEVRWRNIFLREIPPAEANQMLIHEAHEGFVSLFDGNSLQGWRGDVDSYHVVDGAIVCKPERGGTLHTQDEYGDFVVRLEFQVPPGGNNGLAIRYPGEGDSAYVGMCELQVLDSEHPKYRDLDPRQFHGSAYGMAAAHRGYLRPTGEWNFQEVQVRGSSLQVELNGNRILDTDLEKVTEYLDNNPHPGKSRARGHFGFAGHGDPVRFRNVTIKTLP